MTTTNDLARLLRRVEERREQSGLSYLEETIPYLIEEIIELRRGQTKVTSAGEVIENNALRDEKWGME